jgi:hypothetical protein
MARTKKGNTLRLIRGLYACLCVSKQAINYSAGVEGNRTNIQTPFVGALFKVACRNLKRKGTLRIYSTATGGPRGKSVTEEGGREVSLHWNFVFDVDRECNRRFQNRNVVVRQSALTLPMRGC